MGILETGRAIGFTGTQVGMNSIQQYSLIRLLDYTDIKQFHHGDCVGADARAHDIVKMFHGILRIIHPPSDSNKRAFCAEPGPWDIVLRPKPYLVRNRDIVRETDELIAAPRTRHEELRSGTWATVRFAKKMGKKVTILYPNGAVDIYV